ncbi:OmpA family protein [Siminovitchia sp. 179-K 8D1 HS]|uniref:OmpA family protein n=1 Tax=Siminovitchia sp. 179-K 8D1 HS TaxID=3142385 RepID=UPI0039A2562B
MNKNGFKGTNNHQPWLVTFADLSLVILTLFVLLYSYSDTNAEKFKSVTNSFQNHNHLKRESPGDSPGEGGITVPNEYEEQLTEMIKREKRIEEILNYVGEYASDHGLEKEMTVTPTEKGIEVVLPEVMLFPSGKADLIKEAKLFLDDLAPMLSEISNMIEVEGHTDNRPISTDRFPSNWDLSTARANQVVRYLIEEHRLPPQRFRTVGYGEYHPIASNKTEKGRSQNRRVVLIITNEENE